MPSPFPKQTAKFTNEQMHSAARSFVSGALLALGDVKVNPGAYSGPGLSSYDRNVLFDREVFRAEQEARREAWERCQQLAAAARRLRHARAA